MTQFWVESADGQRFGPADEAALRLWAGQGRVVPETPLIEVASGARRRADEVLHFTDFAPPPGELPPAGGASCPNCRRWFAAPPPLCPNCGFVFHSLATPVSGRLLTGLPLVDTLLGVLTVLTFCAAPALLDCLINGEAGTLSFLGLFLGLVPLALYLVLRRTYAAYARGLGGGLLLGCVTVPLLLVAGFAVLMHQWVTTPFRSCNF